MSIEDVDREVRRRRFVLAGFVGPVLVGSAAIVAMELSSTTVTRFRSRCADTLPDSLGGDPIEVMVPCDPYRVALAEPWRGTAIGIAVGIAVAVILVFWVAMPRITARDARLERTRRLRPVETRRGTRYRLQPGLVWLSAVFGMPFLVGGLLLGMMPTGAPFVVVAVLITIGVVLLYTGRGATVWVGEKRLIVQTRIRHRSWVWSDIEAVRAVSGHTTGRVRIPTVELEIETIDGRRFRSNALNDSVMPSNLVLQLVPIVQQRVDASRGSAAVEVRGPSGRAV